MPEMVIDHDPWRSDTERNLDAQVEVFEPCDINKTPNLTRMNIRLTLNPSLGLTI
jgi:hypothetical protein